MLVNSQQFLVLGPYPDKLIQGIENNITLHHREELSEGATISFCGLRLRREGRAVQLLPPLDVVLVPTALLFSETVITLVSFDVFLRTFVPFEYIL